MTRTADLTFLIGPHFGVEYSLSGLEILKAEEWRIREQWFDGSVALRIGDALLEREGTPLLDFALALRYSVNLLAADGAAVMHVADGPAVRLGVESGAVQAQVGNAGVIGVCDFIDLAHASSVFTRDLIDTIVAKRPEFLLSDAIERVYRESGVRELSRERFLTHTQMMRTRSEMIRNDHA
ncbi:hypothetical protein [Streptomyces vinaceus]|uniref:hypothetical protein n=1 Tax=Streptomyces vinaceus TaxID=1960 RepID=UPI0036B3F0FF